MAGFPLLLILWICSCGGGSGASPTPAQAQVAAPSISARPALAGAQIVSLADGTSGAAIHYTVDGSTPTAASPVYAAPFLVASNLTLNVYATLNGDKDSPVNSQKFTPGIPSATLVWSDEFTNTTGSNQQPDPTVWTYDTGSRGFGNQELENYCAWASSSAPCDPAAPNVYVGTDGYLHIIARQPSAGVYTSGRMKSQGLFSLQYGRLEAKIWVPEGQGFWPAFWTLGNNINSAGWPACGEQDIAERVDAALTPDWNEGSVHGPGFTGDVGLGTKYYFPAGQTAAGWHTYGMIWKPNSVAYYIDDPANPYVTYTNPDSLSGFAGAVWPFDSGNSAFLIFNLAVGGDWPGSPDATTVFPASMLVDYVRFYTN
ncbi:MAG TPA: family 16 glycosylhydrolase [Acidobacteriaceae bacterium]|nr:family 16 glycosylhydrolase [Acidobacteriaceae bacterium]